MAGHLATSTRKAGKSIIFHVLPSGARVAIVPASCMLVHAIWTRLAASSPVMCILEVLASGAVRTADASCLFAIRTIAATTVSDAWGIHAAGTRNTGTPTRGRVVFPHCTTSARCPIGGAMLPTWATIAMPVMVHRSLAKRTIGAMFAGRVFLARRTLGASGPPRCNLTHTTPFATCARCDLPRRATGASFATCATPPGPCASHDFPSSAGSTGAGTPCSLLARETMVAVAPTCSARVPTSMAAATGLVAIPIGILTSSTCRTRCLASQTGCLTGAAGVTPPLAGIYLVPAAAAVLTCVCHKTAATSILRLFACWAGRAGIAYATCDDGLLAIPAPPAVGLASQILIPSTTARVAVTCRGS